MPVRRVLVMFLAAGAAMGTIRALAADWADALSAEPPVWEVAGWEVRLSGFATGSAFTADEAGGPGNTDVTGEARVNLRVQRMFDSGLTIGARSVVLAYHDALSGDRYGNDTFEKLYVFVQTAYGTVEAGQQDGAGARLGVTGPKVDDHVSLDDPDTAFFIDPSTGRRFDTFFRPYSAAAATSNAAKFNFISTRLLGVQLGLSLTPQAVKAPLPVRRQPRRRTDADFHLGGRAQLHRLRHRRSRDQCVGGVQPGHADGCDQGARRSARVGGGGRRRPTP